MSKIKKKLNYLRRIISGYLFQKKSSHLSFWHNGPKANDKASLQELGQYYMSFKGKADYEGPFDEEDVPLLDYKGKVGKQYNPIAIAQYGLGNYNLYKENKKQKYLDKAQRQADWLVNNLEKNEQGIHVWMHHFDWEYREDLKAPWYSALAQGNGISLLVRMYEETSQEKYLNSAQKAFKALTIRIEDGGVQFKDEQGNIWLEEYLVDPPSHVLNGFIWTLWGVYDFYLVTKEEKALNLFKQGVKTIEENLKKYDTGFWSLYELSDTKMKVLASPFYHQLHIVQLKLMARMAEKEKFAKYAEKWENYQHNFFYKSYALIYKLIFKIFYY